MEKKLVNWISPELCTQRRICKMRHRRGESTIEWAQRVDNVAFEEIILSEEKYRQKKEMGEKKKSKVVDKI